MEVLTVVASDLGDPIHDVNAWQVIPLKGAMTNEPTKNGGEVRNVLVRLYGEGVEVFFDREEEVRTFEYMSKHGQGPHLLGRFTFGRVEEFIHAKLKALRLKELSDDIKSQRMKQNNDKGQKKSNNKDMLPNLLRHEPPSFTSRALRAAVIYFVRVASRRRLLRERCESLSSTSRGLKVVLSYCGQQQVELSTFNCLGNTSSRVRNTANVMASKTKIHIVLEFVTGGELFDKIMMKPYIWFETSVGLIQQVEPEIAMYCPLKEIIQKDMGSSKNCAICLPFVFVVLVFMVTEICADNRRVELTNKILNYNNQVLMHLHLLSFSPLLEHYPNLVVKHYRFYQKDKDACKLHATVRCTSPCYHPSQEALRKTLCEMNTDS
ncbi:hypothetical protein Fmac_019771 [Flemingia macrophylla]|uniref:Uncharacterized protein n=1 Tax=Flemingia macrophylla TaxID=520843 RepID=A0ABD1M8P9_9FABA